MSPSNEQKLAKLLKSLNMRLGPTVFLVSCDTDAQRNRLIEEVKKGSERYEHVIIDLGPHLVYSLRDAIARYVPDNVKVSASLKYVVHFTGLSGSMWSSRDGKLQHTPLLRELNFERERLFHDYPFISIIWDTPGFYNEVFFNAGDLMSWLVDRYEFNADPEDAPMDILPDKEVMPHRGADEKRLAHIARLEDLLQRLNAANTDTAIYIREKIDTLISLGRECTEAYEFSKAERFLQEALTLCELHHDGDDKLAEAHFYLGHLYLKKGAFAEALFHYEYTLKHLNLRKNNRNLGSIHFALGRVYQEQGQWDKALDNYEQALESQTKNRNFIGASHTYHQIGRVYQEQKLWDYALSNYQKAIDVLESESSDSDIGSTYNQIGRIYENQGRLEEALNNYQKAVEFSERSGDEFPRGGSYYHIASIYEKQQNYQKAYEFLILSLENCKKFKHPQQGMVERALKRIFSHLPTSLPDS